MAVMPPKGEESCKLHGQDLRTVCPAGLSGTRVVRHPNQTQVSVNLVISFWHLVVPFFKPVKEHKLGVEIKASPTRCLRDCPPETRHVLLPRIYFGFPLLRLR